MDIEIICTGDEVLSGKTVNSNFAQIALKLEESGLAVSREITVGDDREELAQAFKQASQRAQVVIVNGGLGPTVDDLSQEIAGEVAGVELVLNTQWLGRMEAFFEGRGRKMPENNRKQAMLPQGAEVLDNPIGTACGFSLKIDGALFFFTPGVPRELYRMLEAEIIPRILAQTGQQGVIVLKRFHTYGLGESHVDQLLEGLEKLAPGGDVKLGFRAHYPQLETKLLVHADSTEEAEKQLAPLAEEIRNRMGHFILAEDSDTLEGVVLGALKQKNQTLAVVENHTGGAVSARLAASPEAEGVFLQGEVVFTRESQVGLLQAAGPALGAENLAGVELAEALADIGRRLGHASVGLAVMVEQPPHLSNGTVPVSIALSTEEGVVSHTARLMGGADWIRMGAIEMGLDTLRRWLFGLPLREKTDFERR